MNDLIRPITMYCLASGLALASCGTSPAPTPTGDGSTSVPNDAGIPVATVGTITLNYNCSDSAKTNGMKTFVKSEFGQMFKCTFSKKVVAVSYLDADWMFRLSMSNYIGPGTYTIDMPGTTFIPFPGRDVCYWPTDIGIHVPGCKAAPADTFPDRDFGSCLVKDDVMKCTVVVTEHTDSRVAGTYSCHTKSTLDQGYTADLTGTFQYGPKDCM